MRAYTVQAGDSPASIAGRFAGCPKCARDLVHANRAKPTIVYPNGYETFVSLSAGEKLALPETWFDGTLDAMPTGYFAALPSVDGGRPERGGGNLAGLAGGGIVDFDSLMANVPEAKQAWGQVQGQFSAEGGAPAGVLAVAQQNFYGAFSQLTSTLNVLPNSAAGLLTAGTAAAGLVLNSSTIGGAVQNVSSLIASVESGAPGPIVQSFTGVLISGLGLAVSAGAVSFGIGAAIVVGIEIVASVLEGVLGSGSPPAATICGTSLTKKPTYVVDCAWTFGPAVTGGPHSSYWRKFPRPSVGGDAWWFTSNAPWNTTWTSGASSDTWSYAGSVPVPGVVSPTVRPIDAAFPAYHQLECDAAAASPVAALPDAGGTTSPPTTFLGPPSQSYSSDEVAFARFVRAYMTAWMANQEYALNGLSAQDDAIVLTQLVQFWNAAHDVGNTFAIAPRSNGSSRGDVVGATSPCEGTFGTEYYYVQMLVGDLGRSNPSALTGGDLVINTGPQKNVTLISAVGIGPGLPIFTPPASGKGGAKPASSAAKSVAVVAGAGAAGIGLYAYLTHQAYTAAAKQLWHKATKHLGG